MRINNETSDLLDKLVAEFTNKLKNMQLKQQYLILKEGDKEIYRAEMLDVNTAFNKSFYERLNLNINWDKWELEETEIDFTKLFYEWWRCIFEDIIDTADNFHKEICRRYKEDVLNALTYFDNTKVGLFFTAFREIRKYTYKTKTKPPIYTADGYVISLKDKYKLYIELCNWKAVDYIKEEVR